MTRRFSFIPSVVLAVVLLSTSSVAQPIPGDDGVLYFPPKLTVRVAATDDLEAADMSESDRHGAITVKLIERPEVELPLPLLFFDGAGSTTIPDRYQVFHSSMETDSYLDSSDVTERLNRTSHPKYPQILNIVGYRMTAFPESRIELEGGYSTLPGENAEVGNIRAEVVRDYLTTIWRVEPERIGLRPPRQVCDSSDNILRQEEAQRVAIHTSDTNILKPVQYFVVRTDETLLYFEILLDPSIDPADVTGIELALSIGDEIISSSEIPAHPDSTIYRLQGLWPAFQLSTERPEELIVQAFVRTLEGKTRPSNSERFTIETASEHPRDYEAILFRDQTFLLPFSEWRDSTLTADQQLYLDQYIRTTESNPTGQSGRYYFVLYGSGDRSELSEVDRATIETARAFDAFESATFNTLTERRSRFPVVFFTQSPEGDRPDMYPFLRAWFGDEYVNEAERQREKQEANRVSFNESYEEMEGKYDTLYFNTVNGRSGTVARYLQERLSKDMIDTIEIGPIDYTPHAYSYLPEERYYARGVEITLYRRHEYSDEDYYYEEGEEEIPDGEYEEEEYEEEGYDDKEYPEEE